MSDSSEPRWDIIARRYHLGEQAEWRKLLTHFDLADGFDFVVLLVPDADGAALCRHELEDHLAGEGRSLRALEFAAPADLHRLPEHFLDESCGENTACLWLAAVAPDYVPDYAAWRAAWEHAVARLNAFRNPIRERFHCTLVFVGAPWLQEVLREIAPDLWSVRTIVARVGTAPQPSDESVTTPQSSESTVGEGPDPFFALQQAEKLRGVSGKELELAALLHRAGQGFTAHDNEQGAEKVYVEALELQRRFNAPISTLLVTMNDLSWIYLSLKQTHQALALAEQSLDLARKIGDRWHEGHALNNLGVAYATLGETRRAIEYHEKQLVVAREIHNRLGERSALGNLGVAYTTLGDMRRGIDYYEQALMIAREICDRGSEGIALTNLGAAYRDLGNILRALEYSEQALSLFRGIGNQHGEGIVLWNLALAHDVLGHRTEAIAQAEEALRIFEQIEDSNAAMVREQVAKWRGEVSNKEKGN